MNLNQITVPVRDVAKSIIFYEQLGLTIIVKALPGYARFMCPVGDATFSLHEVDKLPDEAGVWIYFETDNLDRDVEKLISKGIKFDELPTDKSWLWRESRLRDLDNNQIILYFAGTNRKDPPWKLG